MFYKSDAKEGVKSLLPELPGTPLSSLLGSKVLCWGKVRLEALSLKETVVLLKERNIFSRHFLTVCSLLMGEFR